MEHLPPYAAKPICLYAPIELEFTGITAAPKAEKNAIPSEHRSPHGLTECRTVECEKKIGLEGAGDASIASAQRSIGTILGHQRQR